MKGEYKASLIGFIYSVVCWLSIWTFVLPMLTILPLALPFELMFSKIYGNEDYSKVGNSVLIALLILFIGTIYWFYKQFKRQLQEQKSISTIRIILLLTLQLFIIHPLVFYISTSRDWSRASDGQFIFGITETFPVSSLAFLILGILIDILKNGYNRDHLIKDNQENTPE